jgi:hypothetical protein
MPKNKLFLLTYNNYKMAKNCSECPFSLAEGDPLCIKTEDIDNARKTENTPERQKCVDAVANFRHKVREQISQVAPQDLNF